MDRMEVCQCSRIAPHECFWLDGDPMTDIGSIFNFFVVIALIGAIATFFFSLITGALLLRVGRLEATNLQLKNANNMLRDDNLELQMSLKNLNDILMRFLSVEKEAAPNNVRDHEIDILLRKLQALNDKVNVNIANVQGQVGQVVAGRDAGQIQ